MRSFARGFVHAARGLAHVLKNERNARVHLLVAIAVVVLSIVVGISIEATAAVVFSVTLVFFAEIVNSALEKTLDIVDPQHNPAVGVVKDMAAAGVLVTAIGAAAIGCLVFLPEIF